MSFWKANVGQWRELADGLDELEEPVLRSGERIRSALRSGNKLLACGNGGSASQAAHLCAELVGRYRRNRSPLPALALSSDGPLLTCLVNDYEPQDVFARQVTGLGGPRDVLVALSTSGASENVVRALRAARERGLHTVALLGLAKAEESPPAFGLADQEIIVPSREAARIQEVHLLIIHTWCDLIDQA